LQEDSRQAADEAERPEQLLGNWQEEAERRSSNPLLYMARHTEFIVRRCFLPRFCSLRYFESFRLHSFLRRREPTWSGRSPYSYWTFPAARGAEA
jgi:hypothetical protein